MESESSSSPINAEIDRLPVPTPFRLTHCVNEGQMTPPASPSLQARHGPKLQLSKFFRRSKSIRSKPTGFHDMLRTTTVRPSVVEMKTPFPLLLPESPSVTENSPSIPSLSPGLRRMSASYHDLRAVAQRQANSSPQTPLLPSPISREPELQDLGYFHFGKPCRQRDSLTDTNSIDSEDILTYYCDGRRKCKEQPRGYRRDSWTTDDTEIEDEEQSTASESMPVTPSEQEYCQTIHSDESGWLANTTSHEERMRKFKTRFYQVVQRPWTSAFQGAGEDEVMIATVLVGPGKAKIVQIQRPPSSQASQEAEIAHAVCEHGNGEESVHEPTTTLDSRPHTPTQRTMEVSAFSPYDTPGAEDTTLQYISIESCISDTPITGPRIAENCGIASPSSEKLVPAPLKLPSRTRTSRSDSSIFSSTLQQLQDLADPFGTSSTTAFQSSARKRLKKSKSSHHNGHSSKNFSSHHSQSWPIEDFPQRKKENCHPQKSSLQESPTLRSTTLTRLRRLHKLNRILCAVTHAIDHFPSNLLYLSSPVVLELRPSKVSDQMYVDALARVFPGACSTLLESLTAWILIDLFFEKVRNEARGGGVLAQFDSNLHAGSLYLGGSDHRYSYDSTRTANNASGYSSYYPQRQHYQYHEHLTQSPGQHYQRRPRRDRNIPSKAHEMLGIGAPDVTSIRLSEFALKWRAESVAVSVAVVGHRLVEAIRGSAGWDEDVWRSLRVLVDVIGVSAASARVGDNGAVAGRVDGDGDGAVDKEQQGWSGGLSNSRDDIGSDDGRSGNVARVQKKGNRGRPSGREGSDWV
ncbi:uncharacterized protein A1O9_06402 [Exophiala aquamarina CBS 119918]|uniref:Uncharacterized protein n=1 Tax=Exophiala aquamarina CBS 119918 TaxID=1182545 RepID=A0A072PF22_9EURO|nr:uncharacterized protein A1O9_06402 [Exophiala aquamarina CBS 119918]KEF58476.1 hypothetical protein A1O9_06402 [Exophiala aquamarina CBS 119918]